MKQDAEKYLGGEILQEEWKPAKEAAGRKLDNMIERFGDSNGERRKPYYMAQLIAEAVEQNRFSKFGRELVGILAYADKMGYKKEQPV